MYDSLVTAYLVVAQLDVLHGEERELVCAVRVAPVLHVARDLKPEVDCDAGNRIRRKSMSGKDLQSFTQFRQIKRLGAWSQW